jgi:hypothetical protein
MILTFASWGDRPPGSEVVHRVVKVLIATMHERIMNIATEDESDRLFQHLTRAARRARLESPGRNFSLPRYYRILSEVTDEGTYPFRMACDSLLSNRLSLRQDLIAGNKYGFYNDCFLCGYIPQEDLPWDTEDTDW